MVQELRRVRPLGDAYQQMGLEIEGNKKTRTEWSGASQAVRELAVQVAGLVATQRGRAVALEELVEDLDDARTNANRRLAILQDNLRETQEFQAALDEEITQSEGFATQVRNLASQTDTLTASFTRAIANLETVITEQIVDVIRDELDLDEAQQGMTTTFTMEVTTLLTPAEVRSRVNAVAQRLVDRRRAEIDARVRASISRAIRELDIATPEGVIATTATAAATPQLAPIRSSVNTQIGTVRSQRNTQIEGVRRRRTNHLSNLETNILNYLASFMEGSDGIVARWQQIYNEGQDAIADWAAPTNQFLIEYAAAIRGFETYASIMRTRVVPVYEQIEDTPLFTVAAGLANNTGFVTRGSILAFPSPPTTPQDVLNVLLLVGIATLIAVSFGTAVTYASANAVAADTLIGGFGVNVLTGLPVTAPFAFQAGFTGFFVAIPGFGTISAAWGLSSVGLAAAATVTTNQILGQVGGLARAFGVSADDSAAAQQIRSIYGTSVPAEVERSAMQRGYDFYMVTGVQPLGSAPLMHQLVLFRDSGRPIDEQLDFSFG